MKTNVSIKFNSIEEYREIEKKLIELGYENDKEWNEEMLNSFNIYHNLYNFTHYVRIELNSILFSVFTYNYGIIYNSLQEFLKDK